MYVYSIHVHVYVCMYVYTYTEIHTYIYIDIYTHTQTHTDTHTFTYNVDAGIRYPVIGCKVGDNIHVDFVVCHRARVLLQPLRPQKPAVVGWAGGGRTSVSDVCMYVCMHVYMSFV